MSYSFKPLRLFRLQYKLIAEQHSQYMIPIQYAYNPYGLYLPFPSYFPYFCNQQTARLENQVLQYDISPNFDQKIQGFSTSNSEGIPNSTGHLSTIKIEEKTVTEEGFVRKSKKNICKSSEHKQSQILKEKKQKQQRQINGRNANSNLLRMFFRRLEHVLQKTPQLIDRIISKNKMKITKSKFIEWFQINKAEYTNYIRLSCVKKMFVCNRVNRSGKFQTKIMRILLNDFLRKEAHCFYLTSKKIKRKGMDHNYQSIRSILHEIMEEQNDL